MSTRRLPKPTDAELGILGVLWKRGTSTVRDVMDELCKEKPTGYTTVLKLMQIMTEKGLVLRDESSRTHVYQAAIDKTQTQQTLVKDLMGKAFDDSAAQLVMRALSSKRASKKDLDQIREMLDKLDGRKS